MKWLAAVALLLVASYAHAAPGTLEISWQEPTTNTDGSQLTDLAGYNIYIGTSSTCPIGPKIFIGAGNNTPYQDSRLTYQLTELVAGLSYVARMTAVNQASQESACSDARQAVARQYGTIPLPVSLPILRLYDH